ncbi:hypothetical protein TWF481_009291 [Arthrobotrys musiformis]|uniref:Ferric oxidoreductase domain-containing protein n=1 Tax=Arthrobotrys musiformis TaxID=47236 RepID=A0AAV9W390_9PEZI
MFYPLLLVAIALAVAVALLSGGRLAVVAEAQRKLSPDLGPNPTAVDVSRLRVHGWKQSKLITDLFRNLSLLSIFFIPVYTTMALNHNRQADIPEWLLHRFTHNTLIFAFLFFHALGIVFSFIILHEEHMLERYLRTKDSQRQAVEPGPSPSTTTSIPPSPAELETIPSLSSVFSISEWGLIGLALLLGLPLVLLAYCPDTPPRTTFAAASYVTITSTSTSTITLT